MIKVLLDQNIPAPIASWLQSKVGEAFAHVIKIKPPICFSEGNTDLFVSTLDGVLEEN